MDTDIRALTDLAQAYFDAAYDMDADGFSALFQPSASLSSVARAGDDTTLSVTPIPAWLAVVRTAKAPRLLGLERRDELLAIDVVGELAVVKLKMQIPPRYFTDVLSCAKISNTWTIVQKLTRVETRGDR